MIIANTFSLIIDETTDVSHRKCFTVLVKYSDDNKLEIKTKMLQLKDVYDTNNNIVGSTAEALYDMIKATLNLYEIPFENVVGFAADTTANMFGEHNSVASRIKLDFPNATCIKCKCHSLHLSASVAGMELPRRIEALIRDVFSYFSKSAKRRFEYETFQNLLDIDPTQLLHPCQTRWLSLYQAVKRILQHYDHLKDFF